MPDRWSSVFRYSPATRRSRRLLRSMFSPAGVVATGGLIGAGLLLGVPVAFIAGAGVVGFVTSAILHLRDPKLAARMVAPEFDRDLSALDSDHLPLMVAALEARDRLEHAVDAWSGGENEGLLARVTETLRRMYDTVLWLQRADRFLGSVDEKRLAARLASLSEGPVQEELAAQLAEVTNIRQRRDEVAGRILATTTGIDTLALKAHSLALNTSGPGQPTDEIRTLREELNAYTEGLEEVEHHLRQVLPQV
ncbi:MAG TPA: hypothetical protein VJR05_04185 [Acidimicrobiia bacterium]|nr:hypothetical protein [Acidimicrobiia bacterium]